MELNDGTIIPSWLGVSDSASGESTEAFNNTTLRMGEVAEIIFPSDKRSNSKKFNEYVVNVQHMSPNGVASMVKYPRCFLASTFGGVADRLQYTLRTQKSTGAPSDTGLGLGSKVLVLCINGETNNAVIIGGIREGDKHDKDEGHHLHFSFNGINVAIRDSGELILQMVGPTNADGTLKDTSSKTSTVSFTKDGVISFDVETGVHLGSTGADEALVMGTTYRQSQNTMHKQLMNDLVFISAQLTALGTAIATSGAALTTGATDPLLLAAPVLLASLTTAGATLTSTTAIFAQLSAKFTEMYTAVYNFEAQTDEYLSKKQKTD